MSTDQENPHVCPQKLKFFRVLLLGFSKKLAIPQRLTEYFLRENLTSVMLLSPLCKTWNVRISGDNKGLHFVEGWERFAAAHGLSFGDLLVFKSVGGRAFHVTIFDKSTCEIDYNVRNGVSGDDHLPVGHQENPEKEYSQLYGSRRSKNSLQQAVHLKGAATCTLQQKGYPSKVTCVSKPADPLLQFRCTLVPTNVCRRGYLTIPRAFRSLVDLSAEKEAVLVDLSSRQWPVKIYHDEQRRCRIGNGWVAFCEDNDLKVGDVCVFIFKYRGREAIFEVEVIKCSNAAGRKL